LFVIINKLEIILEIYYLLNCSLGRIGNNSFGDEKAGSILDMFYFDRE
jgi:hypothetical protein